MKHLKSKIKIEVSKIEYNYLTIKITQSRIDKGLLAIPVSLIDVFPKNKQKIKVYFDDSNNYLELSFTLYTSSSRECRIGVLIKLDSSHYKCSNCKKFYSVKDLKLDE